MRQRPAWPATVTHRGVGRFTQSRRHPSDHDHVVHDDDDVDDHHDDDDIDPVMDARHDSERDSGAVLLLILVVAIVLSLVVLALANFVAADLRYTQAVNARAETLSTAESGIDYAVARLRANQTLCATNVAGSGPVGLNG